MRIESILVFPIWKHEHAQHWIKEDEKEEQATNVRQLWQSTDESEEEDPETFVFPNNLKYSEASESLDDSHKCTKLQTQVAGNLTKPSSNDNDEIKDVPVISEVVPATAI